MNLVKQDVLKNELQRVEPLETIATAGQARGPTGRFRRETGWFGEELQAC